MYDENKAQRVIQFINCLKHTKGQWRGVPFELLPWQNKIISNVFGIDPEEISPDSDFFEDFNVEPTDMVELQLQLRLPTASGQGFSADGCEGQPSLRRVE